MRLRFINEEAVGSAKRYIYAGNSSYEIDFHFEHLLINIDSAKAEELSFLYNGIYLLEIEMPGFHLKYVNKEPNLEKEVQNIIDNNTDIVLVKLYKCHKQKINKEEFILKALNNQFDKMKQAYSKELILL